MTYRPKAQKQGDGSKCQWANCGPTSFAMAVDRDWLGVRRGAPVPIRNKINVYCPGTNSTQNNAAVKGLYATSMTAAYDMPWGTWLDGLVGGRGSCIVIRYSAVHGTPYDSCRTFDGLHWIYVNERRWNAQTGRYEVLVYDPLADHRYSWIPQGPQWWPQSLLQKAAESVQADHYVDASFTRDTIGPSHRVLYPGGRCEPSPRSARRSSASCRSGRSSHRCSGRGRWLDGQRQGRLQVVPDLGQRREGLRRPRLVRGTDRGDGMTPYYSDDLVTRSTTAIAVRSRRTRIAS
jgi:hypothetical protein